MNSRQRKRFFIFLLFPVLIAIPILAEDLIVKIIGAVLTLIYVGLLIFIRDSLTLDKKFSIGDELISDKSSDSHEDVDSSYEVLKRENTTEIITQHNLDQYKTSPKIQINPEDLALKYKEIANEVLPAGGNHTAQFGFALEKILTLIHESFEAYTSIFFWYNKKRDQLSIEKHISNSKEVIKTKLDAANDILSQIIEKNEPIYLSNIPVAVEADLIRYYNSPQGIRGFAGVPLYYENSLIGILAIDSKVEEKFGIETIFSLGRYVRLITILISHFEEKYDESTAQERLRGIVQLMNISAVAETEQELFNQLDKPIDSLVNWDAMVVIFFNSQTQKFYTAKVFNKRSIKYIGENLEVDLQGTLSGKSILNGAPVNIEDMSSIEMHRYSKIEDTTYEGSFLAVPIVFKEQVYGLICLEALKKKAYSNDEVNFLKNAVKIISFIIDSFTTQKMLKKFIAIDIQTNVMNTHTFSERMQIDLLRAKELKLPSALALIKIDEFLEHESLFDSDPFPKTVTTLVDILKRETNIFSSIGKTSEKTFAVFFLNTNAKDVFIWAEKLRQYISKQTIALTSRQITFTVSIGVASSSGKSDYQEILNNARLALQKALESGGNKVRNIN